METVVKRVDTFCAVMGRKDVVAYRFHVSMTCFCYSRKNGVARRDESSREDGGLGQSEGWASRSSPAGRASSEVQWGVVGVNL